MDRIAQQIDRLSSAPDDAKVFDDWLKGADVIAFLRSNAQDRDVVVYAGFRGVFIHAFLAPVSQSSPPDIEDLMSWNTNPWMNAWDIELSYSKGSEPKIAVAPSLDTGSKILDQGEQLVFGRSFEGRIGDKGYMEVLQKFVHVFDLHYLQERNAFCRLDKNGDIEDVICIRRLSGVGEESSGTVVTFRRDVLDEYMTLTSQALVQTFDFTRYRPSHFDGWRHLSSPECVKTDALFYRSCVEPGHASYLRGCQIVRSHLSMRTVIARHDFRSDDSDKEYASFIAQDWKNKVVRDISCAPGATANYFTKSDLPFETTPAFFRAEVLAKYKADPEKYRLRDRSISCRGAWDLQTYDINEAGQVHTYLVYLGRLPYQEQLYWKSYNEPPKGPISKRAVTTDLEGTWDLEYDALGSLREATREVQQTRAPWWTKRSEDLADRLAYPATSSPDEWANEIQYLDQLLVEGLEERWFRRKAQALGRPTVENLRSLKLVEECLIGLGLELEKARSTLEPLHEVHNLRSKLKAHATGDEAKEIRRKVLQEHGTYREHFKKLCGRCDEAFRAITDALKGDGQEPAT